MKLNLFLVILAVLLLSSLGLNVKEYFEERAGGKRHFDSFAEYDAAKDREAKGEHSKYGAYGERPLHVTEYEHGGIKHNKRLQDDEYILKSKIVPTRLPCDKKCPKCPAPIRCPEPVKCPDPKPCQPCPPCARCPVPAFRCEKVPNYRSSNTSFLPDPYFYGQGGQRDANAPRPYLNDFSQFGD